jgi:O-methyltransferase
VTFRRRTKVATRELFRRLGYQISRTPRPEITESSTEIDLLPPDFEAVDSALWHRVKPFTMTTPERVYGLRKNVHHVLKHNIRGDFVECGCWKGGSAMVMALSAIEAGDTSRHIHLFDTFEAGWPPGGEEDITMFGETADELWEKAVASGQTPESLFCRAADVRRAMTETGYPEANVHLIAGRVEDTVPAQAPEQISILRLDTDWFESTRHEWEHLFPRVSSGGIVIIDDYGCFKGARKATDEYLARLSKPMALHRLDSTCRVGVKP